MKIYEVQTIQLTYAAACEAIAESFNHNDPKRVEIVAIARDILKRLGFNEGN